MVKEIKNSITLNLNLLCLRELQRMKRLEDARTSSLSAVSKLTKSDKMSDLIYFKVPDKLDSYSRLIGDSNWLTLCFTQDPMNISLSQGMLNRKTLTAKRKLRIKRAIESA